jgi:hypothetical protein
MKYGSNIYLHKSGITVIINGYIFSVFKGCNTNKWQATFNRNIWRKDGESMPCNVVLGVA